MSTDREAQSRVKTMIGDVGFPEVVRRLEVNRGLIYRVWKDGIYSPTVRRALNMPVNPVPVPPCPDCGKAHTVPWCTKKKGAAVPENEKEIVYVEVRPEPKPKRQTRPRHRVSLECDTAEDAAALRRIFDAHGKRRRVARALVKGRIRLVEVNDERR